MIKAIFWDFDGVIAESVNVKTEAFYNLYLPCGEEIAGKVRRHHLDNGGMSRFDKFRHYQTAFLGRPADEETVSALSERFSDLVVQGVIAAPFVSGVERVLEAYGGTLGFYIISGTPTEEMRHIVRQRGIDSHFRGVYGSPESKSHWCKTIMGENGYSPNEVLFIGDALSDYRAAAENGLIFLLRRHDDNAGLFEDYEGYWVNDFNRFDVVLDKIKREN